MKRIFFLLLALSISCNIALFILGKPHSNESNTINKLQAKYPLVGRRALSDNPKNDTILNFLPLRKQIRSTVSSYQDQFAMYFEYLPTGVTIGINEDSEFTAASLLKIPVVMAYFHKKERLGIQDDPTVTIQQNEIDDYYGNLYKKGAGYQINLSEAVRLAIQESDNTASKIIADNISDVDFNAVYEGLDIQPALKDNSPIITAQQYTSILKALYFGSVLTIDDSENILEIMTSTKFNDKLPAGVGNNNKVAHKIGLISKEIYQDCGIVYLPRRNYVLCMISKSNENEARHRMKTISKMIYHYVFQSKTGN